MVFNQGLICGRPGNIFFALPSLSRLSYQNYTMFYAGEHEYTDVVIHRDTGGSECLVIDIDFQSHFEIARAVPLQQIYWGVMHIRQDCWLPLFDFDYRNQVLPR